jgi:nicotinamide mononucleotide transporter
MTNWIYNNWIEVTGVIFTLIFLALEVLGKWTMWLVGIISAIFYIYINFDQKLYAIMGLNVYNASISLYGLYCWKFFRTENNRTLKFNFIGRKLILYLTITGIFIFGIIAFIIFRFTDIPNPFAEKNAFISFFLDSLITTLSIIATWMAAKKIVESWYLWMIVNPCTIALYFYKGMIPSTILYLVYAGFSIVGYLQWKKMAIQQQ